MYTLNSGDVSYVVPMDHIDLRFLRRNETAGDTVKPLWSPLQEEYSEFQLKAWRLTDSDRLDEDATKTTTCHICNLQVPVAYLKEHNNSEKHKNFLQIIDEVLSRLRSNVGFPSIATAESPKLTYYCETCSIIVLNKDKDKHDESSTHKESLKHDELLESFLVLYKKDNTVNLNDKVINDKVINNANKPAPIKRVLRMATPLEELKLYVNAMTKKINSNMEISVLDENFITIKLGDSCMKVHIDNFHGFVKDSSFPKNSAVCLLCDVTVASIGHHIWIDQHMEYVTRPIADKHCIRQITQDYAHCIICNELIRSVGGHKVLALNHKENFENAQYNMLGATQMKQTDETAETPPGQKKNEENVVWNHKENIGNSQYNTLDTSCQRTQIKQADEIGSTPPGNKKNEENALISSVGNKEKISDKPIETKTKYVHYLMSQTDNPNQVFCGVCRCAVPNLDDNINEHLNGRNHRNKYSEFLSSNKINKVINGFSCSYCRLHVENMKEMQHVSSQYHKVNMQKGIIGGQTYCEPCRVYIDTHNMAQHQNGLKHKRKTIEQSATSKDIAKSNLVLENKSYAMATSNFNQNMSSLSKVSQTKSIQAANDINQLTTENKNYQVNITGANAQGLTGVIQTPMPEENNGGVPLSEAKLHYLLKVTLNPKELVCIVCNVILPNTANNITSHTNGNNHISNYNNLLQLNKVVKVDSYFHCNVCDVTITNQNEVDHILGRRHRNILSENDTVSTVSDTNSVQTSNTEIQPSTADKTYSEYKEKLYHFKNSSNSSLVICRVCDVRMSNSVVNIAGHLNGYNHTTKYNDLLNLNGVVLQGNNFRCNKCDTNITRKNELYHIFGTKHQIAMKSDEESVGSSNDKINIFSDDDNDKSDTLTDVFCEFCSIFVPVSDYLNHRINEEHVANISRETNNSLVLQYKFGGWRVNLQNKYCTLKCRICDCAVANAYTCVMEHIRGNSHKTAYNTLLEKNKICFVGDKLFCLACKEFIVSRKELTHIWEPNHTGNVSVIK